MHVRRIARSNWLHFFNQFSCDHHDEPVTVERSSHCADGLRRPKVDRSASSKET
jgi:hypothetical protein